MAKHTNQFPGETSEQAEENNEERALISVGSPGSVQITLPEDVTAAERVMYMAFLGDATPLWDQAGETLEVIGVIHYDDFKRDTNGSFLLDEDGAAIPAKRCVIRTLDGKLYTTASPVAYGFIKNRLIPVMTPDGKPGFFLAPIMLRVGQKRTKSGRLTFTFDVILDDSPYSTTVSPQS